MTQYTISSMHHFKFCLFFLEGTFPPLLVKNHGGPTSQTSPVLNLKVQYFTSRGFAVLDVNYRGSTGYGKTYRHSLREKSVNCSCFLIGLRKFNQIVSIMTRQNEMACFILTSTWILNSHIFVVLSVGYFLLMWECILFI